MSLYEVLRERGYTFRQHLEEAGWSVRKPTSVDLDEAQRTALERDGVEGLGRVLDEQGIWSFPATDIEAPLPVRRDLILARGDRPGATVVAPWAVPALYEMAQEFVGAVEEQFGVRLPLVEDGEAGLDLLQSQDVVLFGGGHENRFAMDMALRYQACFVDATIPGDGGWVVTTHVGLDASGFNVAQIAASLPRRREALEYALENIARDGDRIVFPYTHHIVSGRLMREHLPSWKAFIARASTRLPALQEPSASTPEDPAFLADLIGEGFDSGGPEVNRYNRAPVDIAIQCAHYYQLSGERRALELFRELLFRMADYYLKTPDGASYPADLDFALGHMILYYSRLEHDPIFSESDRLILVNLLLACTRSIYEYNLAFWPIEAGGPTRHNHETFPGRSLLYAAEFFERYGVRDAGDFRSRADDIFSGGMWRRFKQRENANHYETYAFDHGSGYSAFTGRRFEMFDPECLKWAGLRSVTTTDNFFRSVDYGDTSVQIRGTASDMLAIIGSSVQEEPTLQWFANEAFTREPQFLPSPTSGITGIRREALGTGPEVGTWETVPLDGHFIEDFAPGFPQDYAFDKLAFRTGWSDDDQYLLLEGVGNREISHSHLENNGIVRLNHLGRHWVVSNGYGRRVDLKNVAQSFSTRIRGPEDHNVLVLRRGGEVVDELPLCNALLQKGQSGDLAYATGALLGYGGTDWFRTLLILADRFVLVVDRVHVTEDGLEAGHVEWNCLGEVTVGQGGIRLAQQGVFMDITSDSGWTAEQSVSDQSADWKRALESGDYPFATFPLPKLIVRMPEIEAGRTACLATLLATTRSSEAVYRVREPEPGRIRIEGDHGQPSDLSIDDQDFTVRVDGDALEVTFGETPDVPGVLKAWSAGRR